MGHAAKMCALLELLQRRLQEGLDRVRPFERKDLVNHLLQVSRAIDHAVASNQKPGAPQKVLDVFKMITKLKDDDYIKPSMMVFLLAIKGACRAGWFKPSEADELLSLYDLLDGDCSRHLTATGSTEEENSAAVTLITTICQRYCPRIKLVSVILSFLTKKEYETRGCDFIVTQLAAKTKLSLFVIPTENTETSACLVTPSSLSFILNGRGVERRSSLQNSTETGPQLPSDVTHLLRLGNNFIQVVGESPGDKIVGAVRTEVKVKGKLPKEIKTVDRLPMKVSVPIIIGKFLLKPGKYLVAVATTTIMPYTPASVELAEYTTPPAEGDGTDDEVVEAGSRVSLRCPISHKRIVTPVKGLLCRHPQCFDFDSYVDMNELRPVWRCPCCNSNVSCLQLRLDKKMEQILKDADETYFEAIINQDGSWVPAQTSDEQKDSKARSTASAGGAETNHLPGPGVMTSENGIIELSDDDEINEAIVGVEKVVSPRAQPPIIATPNSSEGPEDRKPDIGGICRSTLVQSSALFSEYSSLNVASSQTGLPISHTRGVPESNSGVRHMQNLAPSTHLWSGGNVSTYASSLSTVTQPGSRTSAHVYVPAAGGQSLPGVNQTLAQRARVGTLPQSVVSGAAANGAFITTRTQLQSSQLPQGQLGSEQVFQHEILHQQQAQDLPRQMQHSSNSFRAPDEMDASQRSQRRVVLRNGGSLQHGMVTSEQGLPREIHMQQFGSANPSLAEQLQLSQTYSNFGHNISHQSQQSQRVSQLQQAVMSNANPRVAGGRSTTMSGVSFNSPATVATAGGQQVATPRINPRVMSPGDGNTATTSIIPPSNASGLATSSNASGLATPQVSTWRPAGRMRGSIIGGFQSGNRVGVNSVAPQPAPVSRARVSAPMAASIMLSNSLNLASPVSTNSAATAFLVPSAEGVRASAYNASRLPLDDFGVSDAFLGSGEMLQDVVWLPSVGADQVEGVGTQDVDAWLDETLMTGVSSQGL